MLIGGDFNSKAKILLTQLSELCDQNPDNNVDVADIIEVLQLDKTELKHVLQYLEEKELISIVSIGGPYLYGHIRITQKGISKVAKQK